MSADTTAAVSPLMKQLAGYIAAAPRKALPKSTVEATKHHILDTIAAMVSGAKLPPGRIAISYVKTLGGSREAAVVGSKFVTSAVNAAFANGMLAHADETDDSHAPSLTHPGCGIVSAALAMAERFARSVLPVRLQNGVLLGYLQDRLSSRILGEAGTGSAYYFAEKAFLDREEPAHRRWARIAKFVTGWAFTAAVKNPRTAAAQSINLIRISPMR
jgi:hypothetical protein